MKTSVYHMNEAGFKSLLATKTTAELVFQHAPNIYEYMEVLFNENCQDSVLREWAFEWYSEVTGNDYEKIYEKWMN